MQLSEFFRRIRYVTLKLTNGCNLKCDYCNVEALTPQTPKMSMELFKRVARLLIENAHDKHLGLEFHGGEPMLLPDEWFEEAVAFARGLAKKHRKQVEFPLVTNGTLLTEERLLRLNKLGIHWCTSCDGPPHINDLLRSSGEAVLRAIKLFQKHRIYCGIITVMSHANYNHMTEVMDWYREIGVNDFRVNYLQPQGRGLEEQLLSGEQMFEGMRQVLDHMYENEVAVEEAEMMSHITRFAQGRDPEKPLTCWEYECQAGRTYVAVDLLGRIHACGTDLLNHVVGQVNQEFDEPAYQEKLRVLHDKGDWVIRCFDCPAQQICNHSCSTSDYNSDTYKENECEFTKRMWTYMCEHPERPYRVHEVSMARHHPQAGEFVSLADLEMSAVSEVSSV